MSRSALSAMDALDYSQAGMEAERLQTRAPFSAVSRSSGVSRCASAANEQQDLLKPGRGFAIVLPLWNKLISRKKCCPAASMSGGGPLNLARLSFSGRAAT